MVVWNLQDSKLIFSLKSNTIDRTIDSSYTRTIFYFLYDLAIPSRSITCIGHFPIIVDLCVYPPAFIECNPSILSPDRSVCDQGILSSAYPRLLSYRPGQACKRLLVGLFGANGPSFTFSHDLCPKLEHMAHQNSQRYLISLLLIQPRRKTYQATK